MSLMSFWGNPGPGACVMKTEAAPLDVQSLCTMLSLPRKSYPERSNCHDDAQQVLNPGTAVQ